MPVLAYPDPSKPYILYIDASDDCIGVCLCQEEGGQGEKKTDEPNEEPIHYFSHKLTASQTNWPTVEKELFAIFYALQKLDQYLHDSEFVIRTDHKLLKYIMDSPVQNKKKSTFDHKHPWLQLCHL